MFTTQVPRSNAFTKHDNMAPHPLNPAVHVGSADVTRADIQNEQEHHTEPSIKWRFYNPYATTNAMSRHRNGDEQIATLVGAMRRAKATRTPIHATSHTTVGDAGHFNFTELWIDATLHVAAKHGTKDIDLHNDAQNDATIIDALLGDVIQDLKQQPGRIFALTGVQQEGRTQTRHAG